MLRQNFQAFFSKIFGSRSYEYRGREYYRFRFVNTYDSCSAYLAFYKDKVLVKTPLSINSDSELKLLDDIKRIVKIWKKPRYKLKIQQGLVDVLCYKKLVAGQYVNCELHFFNDELFYFNYTFRTNDTKTLDRIKKVLEDKYLNGTILKSNEAIVDDYDNRLMLEQKLRISVHYFANLSQYMSIAPKLEDEKRDIKVRLERQNREDLMKTL